MLKQLFFQHIKKHQLSTKGTTLLAVSGGVDSVVMCELYRQAGLSFSVAHCNYLLREKISDEENIFVSELTKKYNVPFHDIKFQTRKVAEDRKVSIQVAARDLRYKWFKELRQEHGYSYVATAHHSNDLTETLLYNLTKGTGIAGLHGIPVKRGYIIRPLLFATKEQIINYARQKGLEWREDASNSETKYTRNKIRHEVIPVLKTINPSLEKTMRENVRRFSEAEMLAKMMIETISKSYIWETGEGESTISITKLKAITSPATVLFTLLKPLGFTYWQACQIVDTLDGQAGAYFRSNTHELIRDRTHLLIRMAYEINFQSVSIEINQEKVVIGQEHLSMAIIDRKDLKINTNSRYAYLDYEQLSFPLQLRSWQRGDFFQPFGMNGQHKKVSDFLTDNKISLFDKQNTFVLASNGIICWVVGHRIDERFKVGDKTKLVLVIEAIKNKKGTL